ncbi:MAG TPA: D-alanyl-D-alanine carboxypeptidase/D-alanyl-D-alanine-endopeptidase [Acidimicrobiales bacterium]|jgi:D-alanyl-D-alanine carboxypeptidase/D-alanyl-D-alanine-endopeptidase (penicillin-binding protein 4)|nr:D-alanyl-D-alanine carboxypeptidase/D-alanyl-D-alanine-endopeptidase [Acidimicrobiales bacterium]
MRRFLLPLLFLMALVACGVGGVTTMGLRASGATTGGGTLSTPVLSARRTPGLVESMAADGALRTQLDQVVARSQPATCLVVKAGDRVVYSHAGDAALLPASNEKLLTATAVLDRIGPTTRLRTQVLSTARPDAAGVVHGDLYLVGGGDPLLTTDPYRERLVDPTLATRLEQLADSLVAAGIHRVEGRVVGDDHRYDELRAVPTWQPNYLTEHQSGPLSALTVNDGWATFPSKADPDERLAAAPDPARSAADALILLLGQRGVAVTGGSASGLHPAGATEVAHLDSVPITTMLREMLSESDNQTAELLLKEVGVRSGGGGTTQAGLAALRADLTSRGIPLTGTVQVDGSGLDRGNRVTCNTLVALLQEEGAMSQLSAGLAVAGRSGTLAGRWRGTPVADRLRAKTGTLDDVSSLTGFVNTVPGSLLTFSYLTNGKPKTPTQAAAEQDLGLDLVGYPAGVTLAKIGPGPVR